MLYSIATGRGIHQYTAQDLKMIHSLAYSNVGIVTRALLKACEKA